MLDSLFCVLLYVHLQLQICNVIINTVINKKNQ
jgi:hypothetical protein